MVDVTEDPRKRKKYFSALLKLYSYLDDVNYDPKDFPEQSFDQDRLMELKPSHILEYFTFRAYGTLAPTHSSPSDKCRSTSLKDWKKSISYFHPLKGHPWNPNTQEGNPTRAPEISNFIKHIKKMETRGKGAQSKARSPFSHQEFRCLLRLILYLRNHPQDYDDLDSMGLNLFFLMQYYMIGRADDTSHWVMENLRSNPHSGGHAFSARFPWSKNIREERQSPWQTNMGAMDPDFCLLIALAMYLEKRNEEVPPDLTTPSARLMFKHFTDLDDFEAAARQINSYVQSSMKDVLSQWQKLSLDHIAEEVLMDMFGLTKGEMRIDVSQGPKGTHSVRKRSSTAARQNGISLDAKDLRGCWHNSTRVSSVYDSLEMPFVDAECCAALCAGGPCAYVLVDDFPPQLVLELVPNITAQFGPEIGLLLGRALIWAAYNHDKMGSIDDNFDIKNQMPDEWKETCPVQKCPLVITNNAGAAVYNVITGDGADSTGNHAPSAGSSLEQKVDLLLLRFNQQEVLLNQVYAHSQGVQTALEKEAKETQKRIGSLGRAVQHMNRTNHVFRHFRRQQARNEGQGRAVDAQVEVEEPEVVPNHRIVRRNAVLAGLPKSLEVLWQEFNVGTGGRLPAREFRAVERGLKKNKFKFCRRLPAWSIMDGLIRGGMTVDQACCEIHGKYPNESTMTALLKRLAVDKKHGNLPRHFLFPALELPP